MPEAAEEFGNVLVKRGGRGSAPGFLGGGDGEFWLGLGRVAEEFRI